jgi:hypothetical protein
MQRGEPPPCVFDEKTSYAISGFSPCLLPPPALFLISDWRVSADAQGRSQSAPLKDSLLTFEQQF